MEERTFDLTVPETRTFRLFWITCGVVLIISGLLIFKGNAFLGALELVLGLITLPLMGLPHRTNRHIIGFHDENLEIERGWLRHRRIPWASILEIHLHSMKVELSLDNGKNVEINFSGLSYSVNQIVKPQIVAAVTAFAEDKGIDVKDGRST